MEIEIGWTLALAGGVGLPLLLVAAARGRGGGVRASEHGDPQLGPARASLTREHTSVALASVLGLALGVLVLALLVPNSAAGGLPASASAAVPLVVVLGLNAFAHLVIFASLRRGQDSGNASG